jgi:DNA polymerase III sliding clamp (beta) subunit (PCNA family)
MDAFEIMSTITNAKWPNTEKLFSARPPKSISVNTLELRDAVKRLKFYAEIGQQPRVHLTMEGDELKLESADTMTGKFGEEYLSAINPESINLDKVYASEHLIDVLSIVETNDIMLYVSEDRGVPSFIIPLVENKEQDIFSFLIGNQVV